MPRYKIPKEKVCKHCGCTFLALIPAQKLCSENCKKQSFKRSLRNSSYKYLYGISVEAYESMLSEQRGSCKLCGTITPGKRVKHFAVDHDHQTGRVRGLLCTTCNVLVGRVENDDFFAQKLPQVVIELQSYLSKP